MAEKEIGLIQMRSGKQRNLPPALELGELAFTTDECRAFIGLPSSVVPASLVSGRTKRTAAGSGEENVEILTEFTPLHIINPIFYRPAKTFVNSGESVNISIPSSDRIFIDYIAFSTDSDAGILESGTIQLIIINGVTLVSQYNNSSDSSGNTIVIDDDKSPPVIIDGATQFTLTNLIGTSMQFEYIYRSWNEPL